MLLQNMYSSQKFVIVTHTYVAGAPQALRDFLIHKKVNKIVFIGHPFSYCEDIRSFMEQYNSGNFVSKRCFPNLKCPDFLLYIKDIFATLFFISSSRTRYDVYVGVDPLNAIVGLFLRKMNLVDRVIFYTIDYVPKRFENNFLNKAYHYIDTLCTKNCDVVWNLSPYMANERQKKGIDEGNSSQIVVPVGINCNEIPPINLTDRKTFVYLGGLHDYYGVELIIDCLVELSKKELKFNCVIIGRGSLEDRLRESIEENNLEEYVDFRGFVKEDEEVNKILKKCAFGLAVYRPDSTSFKKYTDVTKPKTYMSFGLPVVITDVPPIAKKIREDGAGVVINYDRSELEDAIVKLLTDDDFYNQSRENAIQLVSRYDWNKIFSDAISTSLEHNKNVN